MLQIVIDKSYLMHKGENGILGLLQDNSLLMTQALFYEILFSKEEGMKKCFHNLPASKNPFVLLVKDFDVLSYEITARKDWRHCDKLCEHYKYDFTEFKKETFYIDQESKKFLSVNSKRFQNCVEANKLWIKALIEIFPELDNFRSGLHPETLENVKNRIINDQELIIKIYNDTSQAIKRTFKVSIVPIITEKWAYFKYIQIFLLSALGLFPKLNNIDEITYNKLENEYFDCDYLFFACLFGALASFDKEMRERFKLLRPDGVLLP